MASAGAQTQPGNSLLPRAAAPADGPIAHSSDTLDIVRETQQTVSEPGHAGLVWWIPFEFWVDSGVKHGTPAETTIRNLRALKDYTIVLTFAAEVSPLGSFTFVSADNLQKKVVLRDSAGEEYAGIAEPSQDAKTLAGVIKPMLGNALGKAGENSQIIFFPAKGKNGQNITDAMAKGTFSIVFKDILGVPESIYAWKTPLTSVTPPVYCSIGKERMHADWEYCPWHGVKLGASKP